MTQPITILIDSREQLPYSFQGYDCQTEQGTLNAGDYTAKGLETLIAIERKSLDDFIGCCINSNRERFKNELLRLRGYQVKAVIIEGALQDILAQRYNSRIHPNAVVGSISSWTIKYHIPFIFAGDRVGSELMTFSILSNYYRQVTEFVKKLNIGA